MSFLDKLLHGAKGVGAQVNPFDNGQTYGSVQRQTQTTQGQLPQRPIAEHASMPGYAVKANTERIQTIPRMQYMQPIQGQAQVPFTQATAGTHNQHPESYVGKNAINPEYFGYPEDKPSIPQFSQQSNLLDILSKLNRRY